ncbi:hypothetical protein DY000_02002984 [Brassica cretica]|uniref:Reverse transcriptase zinc-binding domain-containing protein n=1 Tax=Brassica cretica TaxID=69181 RepID=A0ABQ7CGE6_BRACR|nr:hypothetical protein DY000_02002984 [Brassica cretica]
MMSLSTASFLRVTVGERPVDVFLWISVWRKLRTTRFLGRTFLFPTDLLWGAIGIVRPDFLLVFVEFSPSRSVAGILAGSSAWVVSTS